MSIDDASLKELLIKLLDRAGSNPRLTARLLREKAEERLKLDKDALKPKREDIKNIIADWWNANMVSKNVVKKEKESLGSSSSNDPTLQALTRLAKAVGKGPAFFKKFVDDSTSDKIRHIRKSLRDEGHKCSDIPTPEEIEKARRDHELKKEGEDLDTSVIITHSRKRGNPNNDHDDDERDSKKSNEKKSAGPPPAGAAASGSSNKRSGAGTSTGVAPSPAIQKRRIINDDFDGEAEF